MAAKLTRLAHKIAIQLHLVAENCTICTSRCRRPVRKLSDTSSYAARIANDTLHLQAVVTSVQSQSYGVDDRDSVPGRDRKGYFLFTTTSRLALRPTQPPIQWIPGALSPGEKRPGCEADHSPSSTVKVRKAWSYNSTPPYPFMA
jgi:hypothetical protein